MRNYLLRLGWSHGNDEIISTEQAIKLFNLEGVGKSPSRFDIAKLTTLNAQYLHEAYSVKLADLIEPALGKRLGRDLTDKEKDRIIKGIDSLKERAKTVVELANSAFFYIEPRPIKMNEKAIKLLDQAGVDNVAALHDKLYSLSEWTHDVLEKTILDLAEAEGIKLGKLAQPLRAILSGTNTSPGIYDIMEVLGRDETLGRLDDVLK
jgi:glutamyl-tRNA synthetase